MIRNRKFLKGIALFFLVNILNAVLTPSLVKAGVTATQQVSVKSGSEYVDLKTGDFNYNVPLLNLPGGVPINLTYKAGIANDQEASWVGLGWDLNMGEISRSVIGFADDYKGANVKVTDSWTGGGTENIDYWIALSANLGSMQFRENPNPTGWYKYTYTMHYQPGTSSTGANYYGMLHAYDATSGGITGKSMEYNLLTDVTVDPYYLYYAYNNGDANRMMGGILPSFDQYEVSGPGISGEMEPVVLDNGSIFGSDANTTYKIFKNYSQQKQQFRFKGDYTNSFAVTPTDIATGSSGNTYNLGANNLGYTFKGPDEAGYNPFNNMKLAGSRDINYFTNYEIAHLFAKQGGFMDYPGTVNRATLAYTTFETSPKNFSFDVSDQVGGFSITNEDGTTYHYALPVYVYGQETHLTAPPDKDAGRVSRVTNNNQAYAYKWLLTTITGPDFVDQNNNGIADEGDAGAWTNLNYGKWTDNYIFRTPYSGTMKTADNAESYLGGYKEIYYLDAVYTRTHTALFPKRTRSDATGANEITSGGFGTYSQRLLGLHSIWLFNNSDLINIADHYELTSVDLFTSLNRIKYLSQVNGSEVPHPTVLDFEDLNGYSGVPIKRVCFNYDYSLSDFCESSIANNGQQGKLSLNSIDFLGKNSVREQPSMDFQYELQSPKTFNAQITFIPPDFGSDRHGRIDMGGTPNPFQEGDIIKMPIGGVTYYAVLIRGIVYPPYGSHVSLYDVQFLGANIPGAAQKSISVPVTQTKNPPYSRECRDNWGYFKSDYGFSYNDGAGYANVSSGVENFDRRTNTISSQTVDAWSLRRIVNSMGSITDINYESDSHSNITDNYNSGRIRPRGVLNVATIGYTKRDGTNTFASPVSSGFSYNTVDPNGTFQFSFKEWINYNEEFYVGQVITVETLCTLLQNGGPTYTTYPISGTGQDLFKITFVGANAAGINCIQGVFVSDAANDPKDNPLATATVESRCDVTFAHNGSYVIYEPKQKFGGGVRVQKITTRESDGGDYFETVYSYTNKVTGNSSGVTASEPLNYSGVLPADKSVGTDGVDRSDPYSPYYNCYWCGGQYGSVNMEYNTRNLYSGFYNNLSVGYYEPCVIYEFVTKKAYGNGSSLPTYDEYHYQVFSDDMLQKIILYDNNNYLSYAPSSRTVKIIDKTSLVGSLLYHKVYDLNNDLLNEERFTYDNGKNNQGLVEQVFHQDRTPNYEMGIITVKSDLPVVLTSHTYKDYVKGITTTETYDTYDFYSGQLLESHSTDSYKNNYVNVIQPAYHIYTSKTNAGYPEMGLRTNNSLNRNILTAPAASYSYKVLPTYSVQSCSLSVLSPSTGTTSSKYKATITGSTLLPGRYVPNSKMVMYVTINGTSTAINAYISYVYPDRKSFEFYYDDANLSNPASAALDVMAPIKASINTWSNSWTYRNYNSANNWFENISIVENGPDNYNQYQKIWRPAYSYIWNSAYMDSDGSYKSTGTGAYMDFDWSKALAGNAQTSSSWQCPSVPTLKDAYSNAIELKNINGNYGATKRAYCSDYILNNTSYSYTYPSAIYKDYVLSVGKNTNEASFAFTGFEERYLPLSGVAQYAGEFIGNATGNQFLQTSTIEAHSGNYVLKLSSGNAGPMFVGKKTTGEVGIMPGKKYRASVWVHKDSDPNAQIKVDITGNSGTYTYSSNVLKSSSTISAGANPGDWYLITLDFDIPSNFQTVNTSDVVKVYLYNPGGAIDSYFDDFTVRPIDAEVMSYVYDPVTSLVTYTIDNDNFYTRYEYDNTNRLVGTYQETSQGEKKVSSSAYNFIKQDSYASGMPMYFMQGTK